MGENAAFGCSDMLRYNQCRGLCRTARDMKPTTGNRPPRGRVGAGPSPRAICTPEWGRSEPSGSGRAYGAARCRPWGQGRPTGPAARPNILLPNATTTWAHRSGGGGGDLIERAVDKMESQLPEGGSKVTRYPTSTAQAHALHSAPGDGPWAVVGSEDVLHDGLRHRRGDPTGLRRRPRRRLAVVLHLRGRPDPPFRIRGASWEH